MCEIEDNERHKMIATSESTPVRTIESLAREREYNRGFARAWRQAQDERDAWSMLEYLEEENQRHLARGLPGFTPSIELARKIISNS